MNEQQKKDFRVINGNSLEVLDTLAENSVDAIITDPPYELGFMGKKWDSTGIAYNVDLWKKALRVLKPGAFLLAFGGSRTYHRIACAIEDAGFEIRDTVMWLYGSGFPKSMNIGLAIDKRNGVDNRTGNIKTDGACNGKHFDLCDEKTMERVYEERKAQNEWASWGTCLKPAFEPVIVARKPCEGSILDNVLKYRVGGINIDECRVPLEQDYKAPKRSEESREYANTRKGQTQCDLGGKGENAGANENGRFPANVILTYDETDFDEVCGGFPINKSNESEPNNEKTTSNMNVPFADHKSGYHFGDEGSASRYFYCAKASKKDRDNGLLYFEEKQTTDGCIRTNIETARKFGANSGLRKNIHPTVKPVELMQYLVRLVSPKGATILDIFNGSGSTGKAVAFENRERNANYKYIGIELEKEYCDISIARIDYALNTYQYDMLEEIEENKKKGQLSLFDFVD